MCSQQEQVVEAGNCFWFQLQLKTAKLNLDGLPVRKLRKLFRREIENHLLQDAT